MLAKNQLIDLEVTDTTIEGMGVARSQEGQVVFVPTATAGDFLRVRIVKVLKDYAYGKIEEIIEPSPHRTASDCPLFPRCGGCAFRHLDYQQEKQIKTNHVRQALKRIGKLDIDVPEVIGCENTARYRNKAQVPVGKSPSGELAIGFYSQRSHRIIDTDDCLIQNESSIMAIKTVRQWMKQYNVPPYNETDHTGTVRHIYVRSGEKTGQVMVVLVTATRSLPFAKELVSSLRANIPGLVGVIQNINSRRTNVIMGDENITLWGTDRIFDEIDGLTFALSPHSFYQVNRCQTELLYQLVCEYADLSGEETVVDLYCGIGTISLYLARYCKKVYGVEIVPQAISDARENAKLNGIANAEFICGDAEQALTLFEEKGIKADVVVVDPPRKGCSPCLLKTIVKLYPKRLVYVSCNPATLARDLKILSENGYTLKNVQPVDMFPRTAHVECVVLMSRMKK